MEKGAKSIQIKNLDTIKSKQKPEAKAFCKCNGMGANVTKCITNMPYDVPILCRRPAAQCPALPRS